jgi:hypothetical protein
MEEVAEGVTGWTTRKWCDYRKHVAHPAVSWDKLVAGTGKTDGVARYHPVATRPEQERLETMVLNQGMMFREAQGKRWYYLEFDRIIGACSGEETRFIFVEWHSTGAFHGRPMSRKMLRQKGAAL